MGTLTTSARKLQEILRALPPDAKVSLESSGNRLQLKSGRSRFTLQTLPAEDFPRLAAGSEALAEVALPQKTLRSLLLLVHYAMAQQDILYYLNGLLLSLDGSDLRVVATDGHRLAFAKTDLDGQHPRHEVVLPRKAVLELCKLLEENDEPVRIALLGNQVRFNFGAVGLRHAARRVLIALHGCGGAASCIAEPATEACAAKLQLNGLAPLHRIQASRAAT